MKISYETHDEDDDTVKRQNEDLADVYDDLLLLETLKREISRLQDEVKILNERLCKEINGSGIIDDLEGNPIRVTKVQSAQTKVDLDYLKKVSPEAWLRSTKRVLDVNGFDRAVSDGTLSAETLEGLINLGVVWWKDNNAYLKFTRINNEEENGNGGSDA